MSTKYRIWVNQGQDMGHGKAYRHIAAFEYEESIGDCDVLVADTDMPVTLEGMLNTDVAVVKYIEVDGGDHD